MQCSMCGLTDKLVRCEHKVLKTIVSDVCNKCSSHITLTGFVDSVTASKDPCSWDPDVETVDDWIQRLLPHTATSVNLLHKNQFSYCYELVHQTDGHNKFYNIYVSWKPDGFLVVMTHYGKIGSVGIKNLRYLSYVGVEDLINEKLGKGYVYKTS